MRPRRRALLIAAPLIALIANGCGIGDPYQHPATPQPAKTVNSAQASTPPDDPSDRPAGTYPPGRVIAAPGSGPPVPEGSPTPESALERYANLYIHWSARTLARTEHDLASISLGSARANALQSAASYGRDTVLLHSDVADIGTVISIAPALSMRGAWVIVTSERTTGQGDYAGLPAQLHVTYAQVTDTAHGYVVSRWSPRT